VDPKKAGSSFNPSVPIFPPIASAFYSPFTTGFGKKSKQNSLNTDTDSTDVNLAVITPSFMLSLMAMFDAEDAREREFHKAVLHRLYARFAKTLCVYMLRTFILRYAVHRGLIRSTMAAVFSRVSYEDVHFLFFLSFFCFSFSWTCFYF
jgi:hypothetical protein